MAMAAEDYFHMAKLAHEAQRHDETVKFMDKLVVSSTSAGGDLSAEERNLLSAAYKQVIGTLRNAYQSMSPVGDHENQYSAHVNDYKSRVQSELSVLCSRILNLLEDHLIPSAATSEAVVLYLKMKGDYSRYLAEFKVGEARERAVEEAVTAYEFGEEIAKAELGLTHPMRLGLALNSSVFFHDVLGDFERACGVARAAYEEAMVELDRSVGRKFCKDSELIMQLLKENFQLWNLGY